MGIIFRKCCSVLSGLAVNTAKCCACRFGFNDSNSLSVNKKNVIRFTGTQGEFPDCHTKRLCWIVLFKILHMPAGKFKEIINITLSFFFWCHFVRSLRTITRGIQDIVQLNCIPFKIDYYIVIIF